MPLQQPVMLSVRRCNRAAALANDPNDSLLCVIMAADGSGKDRHEFTWQKHFTNDVAWLHIGQTKSICFSPVWQFINGLLGWTLLPKTNLEPTFNTRGKGRTKVGKQGVKYGSCLTKIGSNVPWSVRITKSQVPPWWWYLHATMVFKTWHTMNDNSLAIIFTLSLLWGCCCCCFCEDMVSNDPNISDCESPTDSCSSSHSFFTVKCQEAWKWKITMQNVCAQGINILFWNVMTSKPWCSFPSWTSPLTHFWLHHDVSTSESLSWPIACPWKVFWRYVHIYCQIATRHSNPIFLADFEPLVRPMNAHLCVSSLCRDWPC